MENTALNQFFEQQNLINNQLINSNQNITGVLKSISEDSIEVITKEVGELKTQLKGLTNDIKIILDENENIKEDNNKIRNDLNEVKDKTNTLEFEDSKTLGELKKTAQARVSKLLGGKGTPQYEILFRICIGNLYSNITDMLNGGKAIGKIKTEDGYTAITLAKRYNLDRKFIHRKIEELEISQRKGLLSDIKSKALDGTLEWMEERI